MKNKIIFFIFIILIILFIAFLNNNKIKENFTSTKHILVSHLKGGLANRIYMILAGLAFAKKWNMDYYFLDSEIKHDYHSDKETVINELKILFPDIKFLDNSTDKSNWRKIKEKYEDLSNIKNIDNNLILYGYFQDEEKYFIDPKINLPEPINNIFKDFNTNNLFFIHFRFGDYIGTNFELNLIEYYKACINIIKDQIDSPLFYIITNNNNMATAYIQSNNLLFPNEYFVDIGENRLDIIYYLTCCKGGICSNSSFSRIGAYFMKDRKKELIFYPIKKGVDININWLTTVPVD